MSSSNDSSQLDDSSEAGYSSPPISYSHHNHHNSNQHHQRCGSFTLVQRARSLSCSSPSKKHQNEMDAVSLQNEKFKEKFPRASKQMQEHLNQFIEQVQQPPAHLDPAARFIHNQVVELAKLCLEKTSSNQLTCSYFDDVTNSLEKLLSEAHDKYYQVEMSIDHLSRLIRKFLLIISRVARLLECIEFDPEEFCHLLEHTEQQAKQQAIKRDIPKYIVWKLGLVDKDPFEQLYNSQQQQQQQQYQFSSNLDNSMLAINSSDSSSFSNNFVPGASSSLFGDSELSSLLSIDSASFHNQNQHLKSSSSSSQLTPLTYASPNEDDFEEIKLISNGAYGYQIK